MATIENLNRAIEKVRYVKYGNYVLPDDYNSLAECLRIIADLYTCDAYNALLPKLRTAYFDGTILPEDHNTMVDLIKAIRDCLAVARDVSVLDTIIARLRTVETDDWVLSTDHNDKLDAIKAIRDILALLLILTVYCYDITTNNPLSGVKVKIWYNTTERVDYTDTEGLVSFSGIEKTTTVNVLACKEAYFGDSAIVEMTEDKKVELGLEPAPTIEQWCFLFKEDWETKPPTFEHIWVEFWEAAKPYFEHIWVDFWETVTWVE